MVKALVLREFERKDENFHATKRENGIKNYHNLIIGISKSLSGE